MQPLFRRVLLERPTLEKKGAIFIPDSAKMRHATLRCKVIAIGPDVNDPEFTKTKISVGDEVIIGKHAGAWLDETGNPVDNPETAKFYIIQDEDILIRIT
jgi:co-chaperonin GroES (HSP10)